MDRLKKLQELSKTEYKFKDTILRHSQGKVSVIEIKEEIVPPGDIIKKEIITDLDAAAIVSITDEDLKADLGGKFNHDTRKLYCYKKLNKGDKVKNTMNNGETRVYTVLAVEDKSDFDRGLYIYFLERSDLS